MCNKREASRRRRMDLNFNKRFASAHFHDFEEVSEIYRSNSGKLILYCFLYSASFSKRLNLFLAHMSMKVLSTRLGSSSIRNGMY